MNNQELEWDMFMFLLEDALTRLTANVKTFRQVGEGMAPFTYAAEAQRGLHVIGDELTRYSGITVLPGEHARSIIQHD